MEMVPDVIFRLLGLFLLVIYSLFQPFCPFLAQHSKFLQTSHVTTQNDYNRSRILRDGFGSNFDTEAISDSFRQFGAICCHSRPPK